MVTRRQVLRALVTLPVATAGAGGYAVAEPFRLAVTRYRLKPRNWPAGMHLKIAALADIHACEPWMSAARVRDIVDYTNSLAPDVTLLLGDYVVGTRIGRYSRPVPVADWSAALGGLRAPLGVHAILGNHDWWDDAEAQRRGAGPTQSGRALQQAGINLHENTALRVSHDGQPLWIAGLGDQWALLGRGRGHGRNRRAARFGYRGVDDLPATLAAITDDAPVILMVHEPDVFPEVPDRVALTLAGHTHGGQVQFFGYAPVVPSIYGRRYLYGHIVERDRDLVVSGGLGCSGVPIRFGRPPEIVIVELGEAPATS